MKPKNTTRFHLAHPIAALLCLAGCATPYHRPMTAIVSDPPGAQVWLSGVDVGSAYLVAPPAPPPGSSATAPGDCYVGTTPLTLPLYQPGLAGVGHRQLCVDVRSDLPGCHPWYRLVMSWEPIPERMFFPLRYKQPVGGGPPDTLNIDVHLRP